jgi:hypothetical protein
LINKALADHVLPDFYPARRVLFSQIITTALGENALGARHDVDMLVSDLEE